MSTYKTAQRVESSTMVELLRWRGQYQAERHAYTFLELDNAANAQMTYGELDRQARLVAAVLQMGGATGKPVLLLHPPGLEYIAAFFGCLYAGAIAVPAYPPHSERTLPRIRAIVHDSGADIVLTTANTLNDLRRCFLLSPDLERLCWIATDNLDSYLLDEWQETNIKESDLAFLQYTSGSTGTPKGVMVSHKNLLHNLAMLGRHSGQTPDSHIVSWLPPYHDLGLVCGILFPFYTGFPATFMSPVAFLQRPLRWLQAISGTRATMSMAPNFAYELCCRKIKAEQRATLDLSSWRVAANGGEPARKETMDRFVELFGPCGYRAETFFPGYGMAETTLILATNDNCTIPITQSFKQEALKEHRVEVTTDNDHEGRTLTGYQLMAPDQRVIIVDPETRKRCLTGQIGEIWAAGPSITMGYWHNLEETQRTFHAYTIDTEEGPFLRTGDLGFMQDGVLFITGRAKDLIIMRGCNYYPQDIELTVERSHKALRPGCSVAFSIDDGTSEQLVVLAEMDAHYHPYREGDGPQHPGEPIKVASQEVIKAIRAAVAEEHELQVHRIMLLKVGSILKTSSGKLQRRACRTEFLAERLRAWDE